MNSAHLKVKGFKCDLCPKRFVTKLMLKEHVEQKHSKMKKKEKNAPEKCETPSENKKHLESQTKSVHLKMKLYKCNSCPKYFSKKSELMEHRRRNTLDHFTTGQACAVSSTNDKIIFF